MKLRLNSPISLSVFTHDKNTKTFVAEASDFGHRNLFQQIYDDACDVGFLVTNPGSLNTILVVFTKEDVDYEDREVISWQFEPSTDDIRKHPSLKGYKFIVFND